MSILNGLPKVAFGIAHIDCVGERQKRFHNLIGLVAIR